jgi:hypothetical protein
MSHGGGGGGYGPVWWLIGLIIILWALWYVTGGPDNPNKDQPFVAAPVPLGSGEIYGPGGIQEKTNASPAPLEETSPGSVTY